MNTTHLHLLLNHFPIIGTFLGSILLLWAIVKNQDNLKSIASALLVLMALMAIPVYLTGEPAEESVEKLPGVSEALIELHEEAASIAIWLMEITGVIALLALFFQWRKNKMAKAGFLTAFILSALCFAAMARTGYYGGQIRHTEIRSGAAAGEQNGNEKEGGENDKQEKDKEEKDDD